MISKSTICKSVHSPSTNRLFTRPLTMSYDELLFNDDTLKQKKDHVACRQCGVSTTVKFYFDHTKQQVIRHKCNSCLGICSIFIVVVISASCYTLVQDTPVVFYRQAEQIYGQYDMKISSSHYTFLNSTLADSMLDNQDFQYNSPRIVWNETASAIYPPSCSPLIMETQSSCSSSFIVSNTSECGRHLLSPAVIWLIDFEKEQRMGFGRDFDSTDTPNYGEVILSESIANDIGVENVGELVHIAIPLSSSTYQSTLLSNYLNDRYFTNISTEAPQILELIDSCGSLILPVTVSMISEKSLGGKFPERSVEFHTVLNIRYFMDLMLEHLPNDLSEAITNLPADTNDNCTIYNYVNFLYVNFPPNRITPYLRTNYKDILSNLVHFAGDIVYRMGWSQLNVDLDLLSQMSAISNMVLSISIVLNMVIFGLLIISMGLLYTLLIISVDSKKFMLGALRMLGMILVTV